MPAHPLSPFGTVSHLGPHTMSVPDAALMMNVLKQPDARDWTSLPPDDVDYLDGLDDGVAGLRIAYSPTLGYADVAPGGRRGRRRRGRGAGGAAGAIVEAVDPGFDDPLEITTGLWFTGAWTLWNTLTPEQQAVTDPDFAAEAELGSRLSNLDVQRLAPAARRARVAHAPVHGALRPDRHADRRRAGVRGPARRALADDTRVDARLDAVLVPVQPHPAAGEHRAVRPHDRRPADRPAARRPDVRRRPRPARRPRLRARHPVPRPPL